MAIIRILYGVYLGFALSFFGNIHFDQWEFYAILVPVAILVEFSAKEK